MHFTKAHGTGNDFVVLADLDEQIELSAGLVRALTDRHRGIGGDGVLRLGAPRDGGDVFMDYRNADGSIVEMCGNGVRVVAKHVVDHGFVAAPDDVVHVETRAGRRPVTVQRDTHGRVVAARVDMGPASFDPADVPFLAADPSAVAHTIELDGVPVTLDVVSMGNPHAVITVDDVATAPVERWGRALQTHAQFPQRVNVGFVAPMGRDAARLRVFERGVGETAACGTGACAAARALQRAGVVDDLVDVHLPGGVLAIDLRGASVFMTGDVEEVAHGTLDDAWLAGRRAAGDGDA